MYVYTFFKYERMIINIYIKFCNIKQFYFLNLMIREVARCWSCCSHLIYLSLSRNSGCCFKNRKALDNLNMMLLNSCERGSTFCIIIIIIIVIIVIIIIIIMMMMMMMMMMMIIYILDRIVVVIIIIMITYLT